MQLQVVNETNGNSFLIIQEYREIYCCQQLAHILDSHVVSNMPGLVSYDQANQLRRGVPPFIRDIEERASLRCDYFKVEDCGIICRKTNARAST